VSETFWVDGTRSTIRLSGAATEGRLAVLEETLPPGPGPPLHSHPEGETFHVLEGELLLWELAPGVVTAPLSAWPADLVGAARPCGPGSWHFVPGGAPHTYSVVGDGARILVISTPAGLEEWTRTFGVRATGSGLGPASGGPPESGGPPVAEALPEISAERRREFAEAHGLQRLGPPPPSVPDRRAPRPPGL
jgi:quercetin dioxygenase-like cupin family protein